MRIRPMHPGEREQVAELICLSTNAWYKAARNLVIFPEGPASTTLFVDVYEDLDPGRCLVAEDESTGRLMGSCFYHPRPTHVSLGIMNVHPDFFGRGMARSLLSWIVDFAEKEKTPVRLVSSAMNLDSFSLYTRAGFVPRAAFQDMLLQVPKDGLPRRPAGFDRVRPARMTDVPAIVDLEMHVSHIARENDWRYFIENGRGIWHVSVQEDGRDGIEAVLASIAHPASNMLGPGLARSDESAAAVILSELNHNAGRQPVFLIPVNQPGLVKQMYEWGARNCEIHFCQVRGKFEGFDGVVMPTFMPETG